MNILNRKYQRFCLTLVTAGAISQASYAHLPSYEGERVRNDNHFTEEGFAWPVRGECDINAVGPTDVNAGSANIYLGPPNIPPNFFCAFTSQDGAAIQLLAGEIHATVREAAKCQSDELQQCGKALLEALDRIMDVTRDLLCVIDRGETEIALANSSVYLNLVGHTVIAWVWLRQALVAVGKLGTDNADDRDFYQGKLQACAYFFRWELPRTEHWFELLHKRDATCLDMQDNWF